MLHGSATWPVKRENEIMSQQAEMRMIRWVYGKIVFCGVKMELRNRGHSSRGAAKPRKMVWTRHTLRKDDEDWVKNSQFLRLKDLTKRKAQENLWRLLIRTC